MDKTSLEAIARWCGGACTGSGEVTGLALDSRAARPGDIFAAIAGERTDGHLYIEAAAGNGAAAALVERETEASIPTIRTGDTKKALGAIAAAYRQTLPMKVVAITGSVGKTTTKEMTHLILSKKYIARKTEKNHNNDLGLPLTILGMDSNTEIAVLELGMNHFGEMSYLTSIARPDTAVICNIGTMHIENLGSREGILKAKLEILEGLSEKGRAIFNGDEPLLWNLKDSLDRSIFWFGIDNSLCDLRAEAIKLTSEGSSFDAVYNEHRVRVNLPVEGRHNIYDALAAMSVGLEYGVSMEAMAEALAEFQNTGMRQRVYRQKGMTIIEDCYNAGPESAAAALEVLGARPAEGRRIAILGSMLELGEHSREEHQKIGALAAEKADLIIAYGKEMLWAAETAGSKAQTASTPEQAAEILMTEAKPGDVLLFKGSRGMAVEKILESFLSKK